MKAYVIGSGAIGSLFACHLALAGAEVVLVARNARTARHIQRSGVRLTGVRGERTAMIPVVMSAEADPSADLVLVCVKAYDTAAAADQHIELLQSAALVVSLQNGIGNIEEITRRIGDARVLAATTTMGAFVASPGIINHVGEGETVIGELRGGASERAQRVADLFTSAGLKTAVSENIQTLLWTKLCVNAAINPLTALLRVRNGALIEGESTRALMTSVVDEVVAVARTIGVALDGPAMCERALDVARLTANNRSSMLTDVLGGKRTEIDFINGSVVTIGRSHHLATPVNEAMTRLVSAMEATRTQWINP